MKKTIFLFSLQLIFIYSMAQYVTLLGNSFRLNGEKFYPIVMNYSVQTVFKDSSYLLSPEHNYIVSNHFECDNQLDCYNQMQADFNHISAMGFNTLRIVGSLRPEYFSEQGSTLTVRFYQYARPATKAFDLPINPSDPSDFGMSIVLPFWDKILELANNATPKPLKIIFLMMRCASDWDANSYGLWEDYFETMSSHFSNSSHNDALFAYDLMNEPAYFVKPVKTKQEACELISTWYDIIKSNDPHHLVTIGNCGMDDIWSFDPSILKVDFNSLHYYPGYSVRPYEDRTQSNVQQLMRNRSANDLYWFKQASIVPWIIGETGFSANNWNDWNIHGINGTLIDQKNYAQYSLDAVCNCGGSGFSWWQYQDMDFGGRAGDYYGLLKNGVPPSLVAEKPAAEAFRNYMPVATGPCPVEYSPTVDETKLWYNRFGHTAPNNLKITRYIVDQDGEPIKDAVVRVTTSFGDDSVKMVVNGIPKDTVIWRYNEYYTHTDINGKFTAIPCPKRYGFVGYGADTTSSHPTIYGFKISAAGAEVKMYDNNIWTSPPNTIVLNKIKDDVEIYSETVLNGQVKVYKGRKSLTVYNTTVNNGGTAYFSSQKSITLLPGFTANAGSNAYLYISPPDCNVMPLREISQESMLTAPIVSSNSTKSKKIELSFETIISENYITVFPNPTNSTVNIQLHSTNQKSSLNHIKLYDMVGREFFSKQIDGYTHIIDVSSYSKGVYFLEIKDEKTTYHKKIIIQ